jgi:BRCA1-associated protein
MVCGNVGCGRYKNGDAFKHFQETGHIITLEFQTQRIWNYLSDCFSHKIYSVQQPVLKFDYDKK